MPFWVYQVPREKIAEVASRLETLAKRGITFIMVADGETWTLETTIFSKADYNRVHVEIQDKRWGGYATYTLDKATGTFEITDADFPYPLEFEILKKKLRIDVDEFQLIRAG